MFERVLIGIDGYDGGRDAVTLAKQLAPANAAFTFAHVYGAHMVAGGRAAAMALPFETEESQAMLEREITRSGLEAETVSHYGSSVGHGLHDLAKERGIDFLVVGSSRRGPFERIIWPNDTLATLHRAPCAVAIAPQGYAGHPRSLGLLGVGVDGSPESSWALGAAQEIAGRTGAEVKALTAAPLQSIPYGERVPSDWEKIAGPAVVEELRQARARGSVTAEAEFGDCAEVLTAFAEDVDLLIVGSRGLGPLGRLLRGSTSHQLARTARCPLLVLPKAARVGVDLGIGAASCSATS